MGGGQLTPLHVNNAQVVKALDVDRIQLENTLVALKKMKKQLVTAQIDIRIQIMRSNKMMSQDESVESGRRRKDNFLIALTLNNLA